MSLNFAHIHEQLFNAKFRAILISWVILAIIVRNENLNFKRFPNVLQNQTRGEVIAISESSQENIVFILAFG